MCKQQQARSSWIFPSVTWQGKIVSLWNEGTWVCSERCTSCPLSSPTPLNSCSQDHPVCPLFFWMAPHTYTQAVDTWTRSEVTQTKSTHDDIKSAFQWGQINKQRDLESRAISAECWITCCCWAVVSEAFPLKKITAATAVATEATKPPSEEAPRALPPH